MINAAATYLREEGKTLFIYRWGHPADAHHQDNYKHVLPGGRMKPKERFIDCAVRECEKQTGLRPLDLRLRMIVLLDNHSSILGDYDRPEDWCVNIYEGSVHSGTLRPETDRSRPLWIPDDQVPQIAMHGSDKSIWEFLQREGIYEVRIRYAGTLFQEFDLVRVDREATR